METVHDFKFPLCEEAQDLEGLRLSPQLAHLFGAFRSAPYAAAPERADELRRIVERTGMCMRLDPRAEDWKFEAIPNLGRRIFIGNRTLERLWAYCYGYTTIFSEIQKAGAADPKAMHNKEEYLLAFYAINWANQLEREHVELPWPDALPSPLMTGDLEHIHSANEIFLITAGRIMLHEIAHVVFADAGTDSEDPKEEEFRADEWADWWMLARWTDYGTDERIYIKRCLGIAIAHAPALILGFMPQRTSPTHPPPIYRVLRFIERMGTSSPLTRRPKNLPATFLWMILLKVLVDNKVLDKEPDLPASYRDAFMQYARYFEKARDAEL